MGTVAGTLQILSAASIGIYAGAMLTEGFVLVPYWRSASAPEFFSWYAANSTRLQGFFGPVTWAAGLFAIAAAVATLWTGRPGRWTALLAAVLMAAAAFSFFIYFERANTSFFNRAVNAADLPAELTRWASWHWGRTAASLGALGAALLSFARFG
jgi:hypothetical protein